MYVIIELVFLATSIARSVIEMVKLESSVAVIAALSQDAIVKKSQEKFCPEKYAQSPVSAINMSRSNNSIRPYKVTERIHRVLKNLESCYHLLYQSLQICLWKQHQYKNCALGVSGNVFISTAEKLQRSLSSLYAVPSVG